MTADEVIASLRLPAEARVDRRVPKKLLADQGAKAQGDRRRIVEGLDDLRWVAALKPSNVGVPAFRDDARDYLEIAVLAAGLRSQARAPRLVELIHRAVPYPVLLVAAQADAVFVSAGHKRRSAAEAGEVVLDEVRVTALRHAGGRTEGDPAIDAAFLASLALSAQPSRDLQALYQGWLDRIVAHRAAVITGDYAPPGAPDDPRAAERPAALSAHEELGRSIDRLREEAARATQIARRVELNVEIKRLEAERATLAAYL